MKKICLTLLVACFSAGCFQTLEESYVISDEALSPKETGIQKAKQDITKGTLKILYFGKPWSQGKPLIDDESGLPVEIVAGCCVSSKFVEETNAYNETMREEAKKRNGEKPAAPDSSADGEP